MEVLLGYPAGSWQAPVAELVDAQDLKSCLPKGEYGFDSRLGHQTGQIKNFFGLSCFFFAEILVQRIYQLDGLIYPCGSILETSIILTQFILQTPFVYLK